MAARLRRRYPVGPAWWRVAFVLVLAMLGAVVDINPLPFRERLRAKGVDDPEFYRKLDQLLRHVELHGPHSGGGASDYDCIVDSALSSSTPISAAGASVPSYKGITEALNDFAANGRTRCWVLIRVNPSALTYDDSAVTLVPASLNNVRLCAQTVGSYEGTPYVKWIPAGVGAGVARSVSFTKFRIQNMSVYFSSGVGSTLSATELVLEDATVVATSNTAMTVTGSWLYAANTTFQKNTNAPAYIISGTVFGLLSQCELIVGGSNGTMALGGEALVADVTYNVNQFGGPIPTLLFSPNVGRINADATANSRVLGSTPIGSVTLSPGRFLQANIDVGTFAGTVTVTSGVTQLTGNVSATVITGTATVHFSGSSGSLTAGATTAGSFQGQFSSRLSFSSESWVVDAVRITPAGATEALRLLAGCVNGLFRIGGLSSGGAGEKPYTIAAGANNNIVDFAGALGYPAAGTDAGAGNLIRAT